MTFAEGHAKHIEHLMDNAGRTDANYRKNTRQLRLRNWLLQGRPSGGAMLTRTGFASANGMSLYVMDDRETDRPAVVLIDSREDAFAIMELAAKFINERDALDDPTPHHYQSYEMDRIDSDTDHFAVQFDNRADDFHSHPSKTRTMSVDRKTYRVLRAVMSRIVN